SKDAGIMSASPFGHPPRRASRGQQTRPNVHRIRPGAPHGCTRAHSETCACGRFSLPGVSDDLPMNTADRPLPAVQRAYFYLVALVAIHMVVLAVANLLRVG